MKNYLKKISSVILAFAMLMPALKIIEQQVFAGGFDASIGVSPKIKQLPSWCWITSAQMMLRTKLQKEGILGEDEYINQKYGKECIEEVNKYYQKKVDAEKASGEGTRWWKLKSLKEFEKLYEGKLIGEHKVSDTAINKETAFLVYLCSDRFYRPFDNPDENPTIVPGENSLFSHGGDAEIGFVVNNVLKAVGLTDVCYSYRYNKNEQGFKTTILVKAIENNSPVVAGDGGHYKVLLGISNNKVLVQETNGQEVQYEDSGYLKDQVGLFFISKPIDEIFSRIIYTIDLDKNVDGATYTKGDEIEFAVNTNKQLINLINKDNGSIIKAKLSGDGSNVGFTQYNGIDETDMWMGNPELYSYGINIPRFTLTVPEDGMTLNNFIANYEIDENYYNLMFDANRASGTVLAKGAKRGETVTIPDGDNLKRDDFKFVCWNTKQDGKGEPYSPGSEFMVTEDTTLYAIWSDNSKDQYTLTFDENGGEKGKVPNPISTEAGIKVPIPDGAKLKRDGYNFICWNTEQDGNGDRYYPGAPLTVTKNATLYAIWEERQKCTLTFDANGADKGTVHDPISAEYGAIVNIPGSEGLTKKGSKFKYWNTKKDGTGTPYSPDDPLTVEGNVTLYAIWEEQTFTVTFDANDGTGTVPYPRSAKYGKTVTIPDSDGLTLTGYKFVGWNTKKDGTGTSYKPDREFTVTEDTTLYAIWEELPKKTFTVTFDANDGTGTVLSSISAEYGEEVPFPDDDKLKREGYDFVCWNTEQDGTGDVVDPDRAFTVTEDTTLYAIWSKKTFTVTFDANGGTGSVQAIGASFDEEVTIPGSEGLTRNEFEFEYWYTKQQDDGTGIPYKPGDKFIVTENTTLYAIWSKQQDSGGGDSSGGGGSSGGGSFSGGGDSTKSQPSGTKEESVAAKEESVAAKDVIANTDYIYPSNNNTVVKDELFNKVLTNKNEKLIIITGKTKNDSGVTTVNLEDVDAIWTIKSEDVTEDYKKYYEWKQKVEQLNKQISKVTDEKEKAILEEQKRELLNKNKSKNVYDCKFNMASSEIAAATNLPDEVGIVLSAAKNTDDKAASLSVISKSNIAKISSIQDLLNKSVLVDFSKNGLFPGITSVDVNLNKYKKPNGKPTKYFAFQVYKQNGNTIIDVIKGEDKKPKVVELSKDGYLKFTSNCGASYILVPEEYLDGISGATELETALKTELQKSISSQPVVLPMNPPAEIKVQ